MPCGHKKEECQLQTALLKSRVRKGGELMTPQGERCPASGHLLTLLFHTGFHCL